jgi:hypothetical protein
VDEDINYEFLSQELQNVTNLVVNKIVIMTIDELAKKLQHIQKEKFIAFF